MKQPIKEQINKNQVISNLKDSLGKIKNLIYLSDPEVFGLPEVSLVDYDIGDTELYMVLIGVKLKVETYSEFELSLVINSLTKVKNKLTLIMDKISFDNDGILKPKSQSGNVMFSHSMLVDTINFSHRDDEIIINLDIFYSK